MGKRDRHGRLREGAITNARDFADAIHAPRYAEIDRIAAAVYVDRNAQGYPPDKRNAIKARARPHLLEALAHARNARAALGCNDLAVYEAERLRASLELQTAAVHFRQEYIDHFCAVQTGKAYAGAAARWGSRDGIDSIIKRLANIKDEMGDPMPASELWVAFYAELDAGHMDPQDTSGEKPQGDDRMTWNGDAKGMTFNTFRNRISKAR